jgi:hypothetical protein
MRTRRRRLGIRAQITLIVLIGTVMTTVATLFVASTTINQHDVSQARTQQQENMRIALLQLHTEYGTNISIASDGHLVADQPSQANAAQSAQTYGKYQLDGDIDYVDGVKNLIDEAVSIYKCDDPSGNLLPGGCQRIATTYPNLNPSAPTTNSAVSARDTGVVLDQHIYAQLQQSTQGLKTQQCAQANSSSSVQASNACGPDDIVNDNEANIDYQTDYYPLTNPQGQLIGALAISIPVSSIDELQRNTTIGLVLIGVIMMIAGVILALLFASAVVNTLQRAARSVSDASDRISGIAVQQAGGAAQQVWAVNAINKALQNFTEMARDISQRTDQLGLMGNQVIQRRGEIAPAQIDSILAYITRSVRDISVASRQQAAQYERMTGAMQAVIEIADQVANSSQQTTENSEQLNLVVGQLQQLVGIQRLGRRRGGAPAGGDTSAQLDGMVGWPQGQMAMEAAPAVRAMRPGAPNMPGAMPGAPMAGPGGYRGAPSMGGQMYPGYGAPAPLSGGLPPGGPMPGGPMRAPASARRGMRPGSDSEMGRMPPPDRAPMSSPMGGSDRRMPLPPLPGGPQMPAGGRMGQGSGVYPRPGAPDRPSRGWGEPSSSWEDFGGPQGRMPGPNNGQR